MESKENQTHSISSWIEFVNGSSATQLEKEKKIIELRHFESFTIALKNVGIINDIKEMEISEIRNGPDFVILLNNERIGVEITRVFNSAAESINIRKAILRETTKIFEDKYPGVNLLVNIGFTNNFDEKQNDTDSFKNELADFIHSYSLTNDSWSKPKYIESIFCIKHSKLSFDLSGAYSSSELSSTNINNSIHKKNLKINSYKINSNLSKVWLLLVVLGDSPYSDYSHVNIKLINPNNSFDSIFLLNDYKKEVVMVKNPIT
ncbi:MAG: hypothetical protein HXX09_14370 [Bacteroidetes bacterium]|nr:hypothetical protein [Bacteroidota bacterium]